MKPTRRSVIATTMGVACMLCAAGGARAQDDQAEIAKKLNNPIANLISVPFQLNYDRGLGESHEGSRLLLNIQPVIPISLSDEWNVISRTIVPVVQLFNVPPGHDQFGLGDIFQSLFFSPKEPMKGWVWGVGPAFLFPSATDALLGADKWAAGPTAVALKQQSGWTYGALVNHVWSFAGDDERPDVNATFMQPFLSYTFPTLTSITLNTESTYNWEAGNWSVPINLLATQVFKLGKQPMSLQFGVRYWAASPSTGPGGFGLRLTYTLVFPK